jgi:hypothetical protein
MKKSFILYVALFCIGAVPLLSQPRLNIEGENIIDCGNVKLENGMLSKSIQLKNTGTDNLRIHALSTDCDCIQVTLMNNEITPEDSTTLEIKFNPEKFSGPVTKNIIIATNEEVNGVVKIQLKADVLTPVQVIPTVLIIDSDGKNQASGKFKIRNNSKTDLKVWNFKPDSPKIEVNIPGQVTISPDSEIEVSVNTLSVGVYSSRLILKSQTSFSNYAKLEIPVYIRLQSSCKTP